MTPTEAKLLSGLLHPLRFASADGFRRLSQVKNLRSTLEGALHQFESQLSVETRNLLARELPLIDSAQVAQREASVERLLSALTAVSAESTRAASTSSELLRPSEPLRVAPAKALRNRPPARLAMRGDLPTLALPLKDLKLRISPRLLGTLKKKQLLTVGDVLFLAPRSYEDRREFKKIAQLVVEERSTILVEVKHAGEQPVSGGRRQFRAVLADASGTIAAVYFQSAPWLKARFPVGKKLVVTGEVKRSVHGWEMPHPDVEPADDVGKSAIHFGRLVPTYAGFERHEQRALRQLTFEIIERVVPQLAEVLPEVLIQKHRLVPFGEALATLHFPAANAPLDAVLNHQDAAHRRLAFDELFFLQLRMALRRQGRRTQRGYPLAIDEPMLDEASRLLPFELTSAQQRALQQIASDLRGLEPMNRLVQGDVGSGKTAVALVAAAVAIRNQLQVALMAPTELLAQQLFANMDRWLRPWNVSVKLLTGALRSAAKKETLKALAAGEVQVLVGTHALFEEDIEFARLGLVIIDEQHRFGVLQRQALRAKGVQPHVLVMTATPIPRTLAMTVYGDLDVSVLNELPPGRTPVSTHVFSSRGRGAVYQRLAEQLALGRQVYVVYPLVEESEKIDLKDATQGAHELAQAFPQATVALLHGRMKADEKQAVMAGFRNRETSILVSTTVIEVGVDVPNATVMVVEHAERFGLSQLHQLRGRVGRGAAQSYCFLVTGHSGSESAAQRLTVMERTSDGFEVAEADLEIRGPGEFLGTRQSGMPELAMADVVRDQALLSRIQDDARAIAAADPTLSEPQHRQLADALEYFWGGRLSITEVG
jgi:ATP-dependent DNA helicase RecG